jgi:hypothetical protein
VLFLRERRRTRRIQKRDARAAAGKNVFASICDTPLGFDEDLLLGRSRRSPIATGLREEGWWIDC